VLATVALHPNEAPRLADLDEALRGIEALAARPRVRGIGETGLDTFRTGDDGRGRAGAQLPGAHRHRQAPRQGA
jgi:TatD DNase family protein